jgi:hypothetical protein
MIGVVQTFGDGLTWHPHVHALVTRDGWDASGEWAGVPFVDGEARRWCFGTECCGVTLTPLATTTHSPRPTPTALAEGVTARVLPLRGEGLLSEVRARLLLSWRHSGFSVHN